VQPATGHKRQPSDASAASSEDEKVPPLAAAALESVAERTEVPADVNHNDDDRSSGKLSDEGLGTSEFDEEVVVEEEKKLPEVSDAGQGEALVEKAPVSAEPSEAGSGEGAAPVTRPPEARPDPMEDEEESVTVSQETGEEEREPKEGEGEEMETGEVKDASGPLPAAGTSESAEKPDQPVAAAAAAALQEDGKTPAEETLLQEAAEDTKPHGDGGEAHEQENQEPKRESSGIDANANAVTAEAKTSADEVSVEAPQGTQTKEENQPAAEESKSQIDGDAKTTSNGAEPPHASTPVAADQDGEERTAATNEEGGGEGASQDTVSVLDSPSIRTDAGKDSDSGSSSATDGSSMDINLSFSSFLSKSKEGGSMSIQVNPGPRRSTTPPPQAAVC